MGIHDREWYKSPVDEESYYKKKERPKFKMPKRESKIRSICRYLKQKLRR